MSDEQFHPHQIPKDCVAVDGVVYSLKNFDHPGGDSIRAFGGNDVTVQYKMIHAFHQGTKQLEKMKRVGVLKNWKCDYTFDSEFEREIKDKVAKLIKPQHRYGTPGFYFRAAFYIIALFTLEALWVTRGSSVLLAVLLGLFAASIGLNVQHDANHGAASRRPWVNDLLGFGADLIGGSKFLWISQHWTHHAFTNFPGRDPDAVSAEPLVLFHDYPPNHSSRKWYHNFQALFFLPALTFYWLTSVFDYQILTLKHEGAYLAGLNMDNEYYRANRTIAMVLRAIYILSNVVSPFYHNGPLYAMLHIFVLGVVESLALAIPFSFSHNFEQSNRYPTIKGEKDWFKSQVATSCTYGGKLAGYLTGGLNFQIEHHLFPRICSAWYPYIQPIVQEACKKHGVNYTYYPTAWDNLKSTLRYMRKTGTAEDWTEAVDPLYARALLKNYSPLAMAKEIGG